jgi:hypothetical protein
MKRYKLISIGLAALLLGMTVAYRPQMAARAAVSLPVVNVPTVPLYRLFAQTTGIHFYTMDANRKQEAMNAGWSSQGVTAHVLNQQAPGTVPLYVLVTTLHFNDGHGDAVFVYTTSEEERNSFLNAPHTPPMLGGLLNQYSKWTLDGNGVAGYIASTQLSGTVPLYRLYHPPQFGAEEFADVDAALALFGQDEGRHFRKCLLGDYDNLYTTSEKEKAFALTKLGYQFVRIEGYVWPQSAAVSMEPTASVPKIDTSHNVAANPDTILLNLGCVRTAVGEYKCETQRGYETCQIYKQQGSVKACSTTVNPLIQASIDKQLFSLGCNRLLGRADEFLCKTQKGLDLCETYRKNGKLKKCLMAKQ